MTINQKALLFAFIGTTLISFAIFAIAQGSVSFNIATGPTNTYKNFTFLSATTTTATSTNTTDGGGYFVIAGAKAVELYFQRGDTSGQGNTGTSTFSVQVSPDGVNWHNFNKLIPNVATSTTQTLYPSVVAASSANYNNATSTQLYSMPSTDTFYAIRCIVVETVDGEHSCKASAIF